MKEHAIVTRLAISTRLLFPMPALSTLTILVKDLKVTRETAFLRPFLDKDTHSRMIMMSMQLLADVKKVILDNMPSGRFQSYQPSDHAEASAYVRLEDIIYSTSPADWED